MNQLQVNHLTRFSGSKKTQYARHCQDLIQCFPHRPLASTNCSVVLMVSQETREKRMKQLSVLYDIWSFTMTVRAENLEARAFYKQHWTSILWSLCPRKCAQKDTGPLCPSPSQPPTLATKNIELSISHHLVVLQTGNHDLWQNDDPSSSYASTAVHQQWRVGALGFTCTVCMTSNRLDLFKVCYEKKSVKYKSTQRQWHIYKANNHLFILPTEKIADKAHWAPRDQSQLWWLQANQCLSPNEMEKVWVSCAFYLWQAIS